MPVPARVERLIRALQHVSPDVERLGRALIRLTVVPADSAPSPRRGYRRVEWIESALAPWRERLTPSEWRRLVSALAMVAGWEALIVQRDVCGLTAAEGEAVSVWEAQALLTRLGVYEVTAQIGAGGMGEVYRARDTRLNRDVAMKVLPELFAANAERLTRFEREAQMLAALNHPHIAHIYGVRGLRAATPRARDGVRRREDLSQRIARGPIPVTKPCRSHARSPTRWRPRTSRASSIAT